MSEVQVCPGPVVAKVDPYDEDALRAWHHVYLLAETHGRPFATAYMLEEMRANLRAPVTARQFLAFAAIVDGETVCAGSIEMPTMDNLETAEISVHTHPALRRRGHGARMLAHLERVLSAEGRPRVTALVDYGYDLPEDGTGDAGVDFLVHRGFTNALVDVKRRLPLPVAGPVLDDLARQAAPHHADYRLVGFVGRCPDDVVDSYAVLKGTLITEAPVGELQLESERYDAARVREEEQVSADAGRSSYVTVALDGQGRVVAYTEIQVPRHEPGRCYQWGTLVDRAHRGHRLGLAVKVANLGLLQEGEPGLAEVMTYNAEVNAHMVGVNERLGFVPIARCGELQKVLEPAAG